MERKYGDVTLFRGTGDVNRDPFMRKRVMSPLFLCVLFCAIAAGQTVPDITGEWSAELIRPNASPIKGTFEFQVEGSKVTGAMLGHFESEEPILDGKIKGDQITFRIEDDVTRISYSYKGKISGDTIRFRVVAQSGRSMPREFIAERITPKPAAGEPRGE